MFHMAKVLIYYVVSQVHVRNVHLLAAELDEWEFRVVFERGSPWLTTESAAGLGMVDFAFGDIPEELWKGEIGAVLFSTVQLRKEPIALLEEALKRNIPTVAIEESNQLALNQGAVNNYILPVDRVFTASEFERRGMVAAGFPERRFEVLGWPFYAGRMGRTDEAEKRLSKVALGLDPDRPVAALTLTCLHAAGESSEIRRRLLALSEKGLPDEYQLAIKPHPIETLETLRPFIAECAPRAIAIEGTIPIEDLLYATDVLLNRGVSQVCLEALFQEIPVVVLYTGIQTPFDLVADRIAKDEKSLGRIVRELEGDASWLQAYDPFFKQHVPRLPSNARSAICERIAEVALNNEKDPDVGEQFFELALYEIWVGDREAARRLLKRSEVQGGNYPADQLRKLADLRADRGDLQRLSEYFGSGFHAHILRSLWIDQFVAKKIEPQEDDCRWMDDFPPKIHPVWFMSRIRDWALHLARTGREDCAREFVDRVYRDFTHVMGTERIKRDIYTYLNSPFGRLQISFKDWGMAWLKTMRDRL
jgi:hypothetical protein